MEEVIGSKGTEKAPEINHLKRIVCPFFARLLTPSAYPEIDCPSYTSWAELKKHLINCHKCTCPKTDAKGQPLACQDRTKHLTDEQLKYVEDETRLRHNEQERDRLKRTHECINPDHVLSPPFVYFPSSRQLFEVCLNPPREVQNWEPNRQGIRRFADYFIFLGQTGAQPESPSAGGGSSVADADEGAILVPPPVCGQM